MRMRWPLLISPPFDQESPRPDSPGRAQNAKAPSNNASGPSTTTGLRLRIRTIPRAAPSRNDRHIAACLDAVDRASPPAQVAANVTLIFFRRDVLDLHNRLQQDWF